MSRGAQAGIMVPKGGPRMDPAKTGGLIRAARLKKGLTQLQLAETLLVSDKTISKWERGVSQS